MHIPRPTQTMAELRRAFDKVFAEFENSELCELEAAEKVLELADELDTRIRHYHGIYLFEELDPEEN
jgi:hypothetical protein